MTDIKWTQQWFDIEKTWVQHLSIYTASLLYTEIIALKSEQVYLTTHLENIACVSPANMPFRTHKCDVSTNLSIKSCFSNDGRRLENDQFKLSIFV